MSPRARTRRHDQGFSLIELCVALTLIGVTLSSVAQLLVVSVRAQDGARVQSMTTILASQKLEALRSLVWTVDENGQPQSDRTTDLSADPPTAGGTGLGASPPNTLDLNTPGYVDFLDGKGTWVGTGASPPAAARYVRRWCVQPLPEDPFDTLVIQVLVTTVMTDRHATTPRRRLPNDALIVAIRARKAH